MVLAISTARQGQLNPNVLDTNTFIKELEYIEQDIPNNMQLPIPTKNITNILDFINLVTLSIVFVDNHLIYTLEIPICNKSVNILYNIQ